MMKRKVVLVLLAGLLVFTMSSVGGADNPSTPEFKAEEKLTGQEVPTYYQYQAFFMIARTVLDDPNQEVHRHFFEEKLGLPPKPEVALAVRKAVEDGSAVLRRGKREKRATEIREGETSRTLMLEGGALHPDDFGNDVAYRAEVRRRERERARGLGRVLGELEATLEAVDVSLQRVHQHITGDMAATMSMISTDEINADHHVWQVEHSFEAGRHSGYQSTKSGKDKS